VVDGLPASIDLSLSNVDLRDRKERFLMHELRGELHWRSGAPAPPSYLAWSSGGSYGLRGGAARIEFQFQDRDFRLLRPARIPIFDGALRIERFSAEDIGLPSMRSSVEGEIEPIGMPLLSRAFGWPELAGTLRGSIPRVEYRDKVVTFHGDAVARVFDGRIVGSNMRLQDPLGPWPRFFADIKIDNLDLLLVTGTFSFGSITGRLSGSIDDLELFKWSPVRFDARLGTPPRDRSRRRISAKAVTELANIGGGGNSVLKSLQSGIMRFFDEYDYERLGIRCQLDGEVCRMSGIERSGVGYYLVKGRGLPRIDIVGTVAQVNWRQLVAQVSANMQGEGKIRVQRGSPSRP
ncbi:MAG: hypothetical protein NZM12_09105, partial [Steroidobacteraceae bacterium]|nr:hypothetical protein [Steroidobacteraceae bacterium]MDW8260560.1 hypothetical protein [Gammaproteobacteria bacterium]